MKHRNSLFQTTFVIADCFNVDEVCKFEKLLKAKFCVLKKEDASCNVAQSIEFDESRVAGIMSKLTTNERIHTILRDLWGIDSIYAQLDASPKSKVYMIYVLTLKKSEQIDLQIKNKTFLRRKQDISQKQSNSEGSRPFDFDYEYFSSTSLSDKVIHIDRQEEGIHS